MPGEKSRHLIMDNQVDPNAEYRLIIISNSFI